MRGHTRQREILVARNLRETHPERCALYPLSRVELRARDVMIAVNLR